jgi:hypothetical protein
MVAGPPELKNSIKTNRSGLSTIPVAAFSVNGR